MRKPFKIVNERLFLISRLRFFVLLPQYSSASTAVVGSFRQCDTKIRSDCFSRDPKLVFPLGLIFDFASTSMNSSELGLLFPSQVAAPSSEVSRRRDSVTFSLTRAPLEQDQSC